MRNHENSPSFSLLLHKELNRMERASMIMVDGAKIGIGLYGRTYGWYGPYGHDQPKTYQVDHLSTFEECAILGHKVYGHDIRTAKSDHVLGDKARRRACETIQGRKIHLAYSKMP
ncbi:hypothetical protein YC2023_089242 [Brassica napus]